jgi:hypothetical protein
MERVADDVWSTQLWLPDNPEGKSQGSFEYAGKRDALTYGWQLANEVFKVASDVIGSIPTG